MGTSPEVKGCLLKFSDLTKVTVSRDATFNEKFMLGMKSKVKGEDASKQVEVCTVQSVSKIKPKIEISVRAK